MSNLLLGIVLLAMLVTPALILCTFDYKKRLLLDIILLMILGLAFCIPSTYDPMKETSFAIFLLIYVVCAILCATRNFDRLIQNDSAMVENHIKNLDINNEEVVPPAKSIDLLKSERLAESAFDWNR